MATRIARIDIEDGLMLPNGRIHTAPLRVMMYCRLPSGWLDGEALHADKLELVLAQLYGAGWRRGNSDGSRYVVQHINVHVLAEDELHARPWLASPASGVRVLCYDAPDDARSGARNRPSCRDAEPRMSSASRRA
jgi:hypothetical protein